MDIKRRRVAIVAGELMRHIPNTTPPPVMNRSRILVLTSPKSCS